ncbi:uncharacterized protein LOC143041046 isoform X1 [Oratosquilla oratoria]|uniref:uncharacterized protein LOC143041046 isoform X1 n=1 Tax=Oratosquilla oratoria TaxID=337810 RepID=UPI003F768EA1
MSSVANTVWKTVKPHVPLIRFRKGKMDQLGVAVSNYMHQLNTQDAVKPLVQGHDVRGMEAIQAAVTPPVTAAPAAAKPQVVLEEWQVPLRYRRERLTEEEIEYINRGGPA